MEYEMVFEVSQKYTAKELGSGSLLVLGTPGLIAMVENVCMNAIEKELGEGNTSVGASISINHMKPSRKGALINIQASLVKINGKSYDFEYKAFEGEKLIATGNHSRVKVNITRFMENIN